MIKHFNSNSIVNKLNGIRVYRVLQILQLNRRRIEWILSLIVSYFYNSNNNNNNNQ